MERTKMETIENLEVVVEGNPGAVVVVVSLLREAEDEMGMMDIVRLDDMNIRGSQIWLAFKDYCGEDLELLRELVRARDEDMVEAVNIANAKQGSPFKAVQRGASYYQYPAQYEFGPGELEEYAKKPFVSYKNQHPEFEQ